MDKKDYAINLLSRFRQINGTKIDGTDEVVVDSETGEVKGEYAIKRYSTAIVDNEHFTKIFKNDIRLSDLSNSLSKISMQIIFYIIENLQKNRIDITLKPKYLAEKFKQKSRTRIYSALKELTDVNIISCVDKDVYLYEVNPAVLFNGNRIEFVSKTITEADSSDGWKLKKYEEIKMQRV